MQDLKYWYDPVGNITYYIDDAQDTLYFANTVSSSSGNYTYDALYRLIICSGREHAGGNNSITASDSVRTFGGVPYTNSPGAVRNYTQYYTYDQVGNMTQMKHTTTGGTGNWTRDFTTSTTSNKLTGTSIGSTGSGTETYTYDNRGNIISGFNHLYELVYNAENRLEQVTDAAGIVTYYQYDHSGQRVRKVTEVSATITRERKYAGGWELYRQIDPSTSTITSQRETLHVMDDRTRVAIIDSNAVDSLVRYQYTNHLGTATLEVDDATNVITYEEYYPEFIPLFCGSSTAFTTTQNVLTTKRYRYICKERDDESGFYYMGARYYCPWLARWLATDPINNEWYNLTHGNPGRNVERQFVELTASSYEYCYANPVRFTDPIGEQPPEHVTAVHSVTQNMEPATAVNDDQLLIPKGYQVMTDAAVDKDGKAGFPYVVALKSPGGEVFKWNAEAQWYKSDKGNEFDNPWHTDIANALRSSVEHGIGQFAQGALEKGDPFANIEQAYSQYKESGGGGGAIGFIGSGIKQSIGQTYSNFMAGGHRRTNALISTWQFSANVAAPSESLGFSKMATGMAGVGYFKLGYKVIGEDFYKLHPRMTDLSREMRGIGFGQFDAGHRASSFLRNEMIQKGKVGIKDYKTIHFNLNVNGQDFSLGVNPWTRKIFHQAPGVFK